jgi:hypothetical protein
MAQAKLGHVARSLGLVGESDAPGAPRGISIRIGEPEVKEALATLQQAGPIERASWRSTPLA